MKSSRLASAAAVTRIAGLVLLLVFAALYLFTLDDGLRPGELQGGDLITHQYAQVQGRFSNAPGYPLYTMGGWLWFHTGRLLFGPNANPIRILSGYSTLWALVALALLYRLCLLVTADDHHPAGRWPLAFLVTGFYGLTYFFWYYAVTTEQYTSSVAWTLAVVLLAFLWENKRRAAYLLALALLTGIGLAHQVTVLAILPPLLWFVLSAEPRLLRRGRLIFTALLLVLFPLLSYIFVYVRGAQHPEWRGAGEWKSTWDWFLSFLSTRQGRGELTWSLDPLFTAEFPSIIWREMTWPGLLAGLAGIAALGRRRALLLYATILIYAAFCWIDRLGNWYQVIMPVYALLALGLAAGAARLLRRATAPRTHPTSEVSQTSEVSPRLNPPTSEVSQTSAVSYPRSRLLTPAVLVLLIALAAYRGILSYPRANQHGHADDLALAPGWAILADDPPPGLSILATQEEALALNYLGQVWTQRPDLHAIASRDARRLLRHGQQVAATTSAFPIVTAEVASFLRFSAIGPGLAWVRVEPSTAVPPGLLPWTHDFGDQLRLLGGTVRRDALGRQVVRLDWQALRAPDQDWSVSVRLTQDGQEIAQQDRAAPVNGAYPTTRWLPGEVVGDAWAFDLPPDAAPDGLAVILYRRGEDGAFVNLDVARFPLAPQ